MTHCVVIAWADFLVSTDDYAGVDTNEEGNECSILGAGEEHTNNDTDLDSFGNYNDIVLLDLWKVQCLVLAQAVYIFHNVCITTFSSRQVFSVWFHEL